MTHHLTFSVPAGLPESKRNAALNLQVHKSFPFKDPAFAAAWKGNEATVYAWDNARVQAAQDTANVPRNTAVVPETFIRAPGANGPRLATMLDGVEGQYWNDGFLRASRWWPKIPDATEWQKFLRSVGLATNDTSALSEPANIALLDRPWTEGTFSLDDWASLLQSQRVLAIAATIAICPFVFLAGQISVYTIATSSLMAERTSLDAANQNIRTDRTRAYTNLTAVEDFMKLDEYPDQALTLSGAIKLLVNTGNPRVMSWNYDRGNLEILLRGDQTLDPTAYITLFERDQRFENVSGTLIGPERDLQIRMAVTKRALAEVAQ